ncbi:hypothetical protein B0H11DRAFT_780632 [Mycena galericulata]|nr:hypothetical protein B0H11DRAFT_780632 [Mycena galericulata]
MCPTKVLKPQASTFAHIFLRYMLVHAAAAARSKKDCSLSSSLLRSRPFPSSSIRLLLQFCSTKIIMEFSVAVQSRLLVDVALGLCDAITNLAPPGAHCTALPANCRGRIGRCFGSPITRRDVQCTCGRCRLHELARYHDTCEYRPSGPHAYPRECQGRSVLVWQSHFYTRY